MGMLHESNNCRLLPACRLQQPAFGTLPQGRFDWRRGWQPSDADHIAIYSQARPFVGKPGSRCVVPLQAAGVMLDHDSASIHATLDSLRCLTFAGRGALKVDPLYLAITIPVNLRCIYRNDIV